jgi:sugar lactone lactonase YvrE
MSKATATAPAPALPADLEWLNATGPGGGVPRPGMPTVLAFVNLGSAWSQRQLRRLEALGRRLAPRLQAVAVHVPRFEHERDPRRMRRQLDRHGIALPVVHDPDWIAWQQYGIEAWPTLVLVDGQGRIALRQAGDAALEAFERALEDHVEATPVPDYADEAPSRRSAEPELPLRFPVGIAVAADYLYLADSGHHRVLECSHSGQVLRVFGTGAPDFVDGPGGDAAFRRPHGLCLGRGALYVADAGNHALRRIDLRTGEVSTLCGDGRPGPTTPGRVEAPGAVRMDDPRGLAVGRDCLYVAQAGDNSIWAYDLGAGTLSRLAGEGVLDVRDGTGADAAFAQPVALAVIEQVLYVCDALGSAIRSVRLGDGRVQTLVGSGPWEFGDDDGPRAGARLQAPQAIALDPRAPVLWIADTGNDRLRSLRLGGGELSGHALSQPLHGPAGLAVGAGVLWIADTDAHALLRLDPDTGALHHVPVGE